MDKTPEKTNIPSAPVNEIHKLCNWLTGSLDMADRFRSASAVTPEYACITKYHPYYLENLREPGRLDEALSKLDDKGADRKVVKKLIFKGAPKIGKTRAVYEKVFKRLGDFIVFAPSPAELGRLESLNIRPMSTVKGLKVALFLDDLDEYVINSCLDLRGLVSRLEGACDRLLVVAALRTGEETDKIMEDREARRLLSNFQEIGFREISEAEAGQLAREVGIQDFEFDNATPGSVVLDLKEMRRRLQALGKDERAVCTALKLLSRIFMPEPEKNLVKVVSDVIFRTSFSKGLSKWNLCINKLKGNDLIIEVNNSIKAPHRDFCENVYNPDYGPERHTLDALEKIFVNNKYAKGLLRLGDSYAILWQDYDSPVRCYQKASKIQPDRIEAWIKKGDCLVKLGQYEPAMKSYKKAIDIDANNAAVWYKRGNCLIEDRRSEDAVNSFDRVLEIDPNDADAWFNRGVSLVQQGNYRDAINSYDRALEIEPRKFKAWVNKGIGLTELGRHEDAIKCYTRSLDINPRNILAWNSLGSRLDHLGRHEDAIKSYNRALEIDPVFAPALYNKGLCLEKMGKTAEANRYKEKALQLDSHLTDAPPALENNITWHLTIKPDRFH
ncbi:MAG: tetratricopeptide repeat protein [Candidatus Brocadiales bacterium]|nr:tetratricopeptide repeat protein [Candidatus Bathyanammoxibius amoris]